MPVTPTVSNGIQTSFVQKGKRAKEKREKDYVRQELARVRATANVVQLAERLMEQQLAEAA